MPANELSDIEEQFAIYMIYLYNTFFKPLLFDRMVGIYLTAEVSNIKIVSCSVKCVSAGFPYCLNLDTL